MPVVAPRLMDRKMALPWAHTGRASPERFPVRRCPRVPPGDPLGRRPEVREPLPAGHLEVRGVGAPAAGLPRAEQGRGQRGGHREELRGPGGLRDAFSGTPLMERQIQ